MKLIWNETILAGEFHVRWFSPSYFSDYGHVPEDIGETDNPVRVFARAVYSDKYGVLWLSLSCGNHDAEDYDFTPETQSIYRSFPNKEAAIRFVIGQVDAYVALVQETIPADDTRTDEQVKNDWRVKNGQVPTLPRA